MQLEEQERSEYSISELAREFDVTPRAIRFYEKHGFKYAGDDVNPVSGRPVNRMSWRP